MSARPLKRQSEQRIYASVFAALGDTTRLELIARLAGGESHSISALTDGSRLTRQAITKHLRVLEGAGVVRNVRSGRESLFVFEPALVQKAKTYLEFVSEQWDESLSRLKLMVEKGGP